MDNARYFSLETVRRSGVAVATPVWFALHADAYYVFSTGDAGKVKRLRHTPSVRIAECDMRGKVQGPRHATTATLVDETGEHQGAYAALLRKYGWQMRLANWLSALSGKIKDRRLIRIERPPDVTN